MKTTETVLSVEDIYDGKVIKVKKYTVALPDGRKAFREEVLHHGGACALAVDGGDIVFVSQYRLAAREELLELPAGKMNEGEDPMLCAARELKEETGLIAKRMELISAFYPSPGYTDEKIYVYHCTDFEKGDNALDDGEFLNVVRVPQNKAFRMLDEGLFADGKTVVALLYLKSLLQKA